MIHESRFVRSTLCLAAAAFVAAGAEEPPKSDEPPRHLRQPLEILPDRSQGLAGVVGPFLWGRAADLGAEARFADAHGAPAAEGDFLWLYQFKRGGRKNPECIQLHERNNLTSIHPGIGYDFQPTRVFMHTTLKSHVLKLMVGYVAKDFRWMHGDNMDMVHMAGTPRVCAFVPLARIAETNTWDQEKYAVDTSHDQPTVGVFELAAGETIASGPIYSQIAKQRILLDLRQTLGGKTPNCPIAWKPMFRFTIEGQGRWTLKMEPDGRDGLKGGTDENGWDLVFTETSPGARPYSVNLEPANSKWALSVFSPGGSEQSSELLLGLMPFDRATGQPVPWPQRDQHIRTRPLVEIEKALAAGALLSLGGAAGKNR